MAKLIVTAAPPTSNGDLHLGHISGPYLGADVFARVRRMMGDDVLCVSYSDDYQSYVQRKAFELGAQAKDLPEASLEIAKCFREKMAATLSGASIDYDNFMYSSESVNLLPAIALFFRSAEAKGVIKRKQVFVPFSNKHQVWGYEAFARGTCHNCGASTDTSQCETCAFPPEIGEMDDLKCVLDDSALEMRHVTQMFLDLNACKDFLREFYQNIGGRPALRQFCNEILEKGPRLWAVSRPGDWGPELPEEPGASIHTWFAGIAGYLAASMDWAAACGRPDDWRRYWMDDQASIINFIGFDCSFSHAVVYPVLLSCTESTPSVRRVYTNQFLNLNGHGFSTSRGLAIWAGDFFRYVDSDLVRFYLALNAPEQEESDFQLSSFQEKINGNFVSTLQHVISKIVVSESVSSELRNQSGIEQIRRAYLEASDIDNFTIRGIAKALDDLLVMMGSASEQELPQLLALFAALSTPITPKLAVRLGGCFNMDHDWINAWLSGNNILPAVIVSARTRKALSLITIPAVSNSVITLFEGVVAKAIDSQAQMTDRSCKREAQIVT